MGIVLLSAIQGAGKTEITELLAQRFCVPVAEVSTLMFEQLSATGQVQTRDQLRDLVWSDNRKLFLETMRQYLSAMQGKTGILVTHASPRRSLDAYYPLPYADFSSDGLTAIVTLIAPPQQILDRIKRDTSRKRAATTLQLIADEQRRYLFTANTIAQQLNLAAFVVSNPDGKQMDAVQALFNIVSN